MKHRSLSHIGMLLALFMFSACSKQNEQAAPARDFSDESESIVLLNLYSRSLAPRGFSGSGFFITELKNNGKIGIVAFRAKWTIKDDLDETVSDQVIRYTSDTPYITAEGSTSSHVISPGEKILIINSADSGAEDKVFATTKENITNICNILETNPSEVLKFPDAGGFFSLVLGNKNLDSDLIKKKTEFAVEKIVSQ